MRGMWVVHVVQVWYLAQLTCYGTNPVGTGGVGRVSVLWLR